MKNKNIEADNRLLPDDEFVYVKENVIWSEIKCPVCLDVITGATIVRECLHRFCSGCIETALRQSHLECPCCRTHLPSRRSLRKDPLFDEIIRSLYPTSANLVESSDGKKAVTNRRAAKFTKTSRMPAEKSKKRVFAEIDSEPTVNLLGSVCFRLVPEETGTIKASGLQPLQYIRVPAETTVLDVKTYLTKKFPEVSRFDVSLSCCSTKSSQSEDAVVDQNEHSLPDKLSMKDVCLNYWDQSSELCLVYKFALTQRTTSSNTETHMVSS